MEGNSRASLALVRAPARRAGRSGRRRGSRPWRRLAGPSPGCAASPRRSAPPQIDLYAAADLLTREVGLRRALADPGHPGRGASRAARPPAGRASSARSRSRSCATAVSARWSRPVRPAGRGRGARRRGAARQRAGGRRARRGRGRALPLRPHRRPHPAPVACAVRPWACRPSARPRCSTGCSTTGCVRRPAASSAGSSTTRAAGESAVRSRRWPSSRRSAASARSPSSPSPARSTTQQADRLRAAIARAFGTEVVLQLVIDPTVLGGVSVRVGDEIVDGTVIRRLAEARRQLRR